MTPEPEDGPAGGSKTLGLLVVTLDVAIELGSPVACVRGWSSTTFRASVPETTVHKHGDLLSRKGEVGTGTSDFEVAAPAANAYGPHESSELLLQRGVLAGDCSHSAAALLALGGAARCRWRRRWYTGRFTPLRRLRWHRRRLPRLGSLHCAARAPCRAGPEPRCRRGASSARSYRQRRSHRRSSGSEQPPAP